MNWSLQFSSSFALVNFSLLGSDNVRGKISAYIFAPYGGNYLLIKSIFFLLQSEWLQKE